VDHGSPVLPSFAGIHTLFRAPFRAIAELGPGVIAAFGVPHDTTATNDLPSRRPSTRYGPHQIREHSVHLLYHWYSAPGYEMIDVITGRRMRMRPNQLVDVGDLSVYPADIPRTTEAVAGSTREIVKRGAFPIALGGDHYVTYPLFLGFSHALTELGRDKKIGYIQFDAHLDLADQDVVYGKYYHGSNARRISELECVNPANMCWVGTSMGGYTSIEQWEWIKRNDARMYTMKDVRSRGIVEVTKEAIDRASEGTDVLYISLDIDICDVSVAPGTGSINFGGISSVEFLQIIETLAALKNIGMLDLVEVAPFSDPAGMTARLAATAILNFLTPRIFDVA
jgi:agmatinase